MLRVEIKSTWLPDTEAIIYDDIAKIDFPKKIAYGNYIKLHHEDGRVDMYDVTRCIMKTSFIY